MIVCINTNVFSNQKRICGEERVFMRESEFLKRTSRLFILILTETLSYNEKIERANLE